LGGGVHQIEFVRYGRFETEWEGTRCDGSGSATKETVVSKKYVLELSSEDAEMFAHHVLEGCSSIAGVGHSGSLAAQAAEQAQRLRDAARLLLQEAQTKPRAPRLPRWVNQLHELRVSGWSVAVHNDYRLRGKRHTFWLFTKGDRAVKGEGETDAVVIAECSDKAQSVLKEK
jgi:hypothetical protein